MPNFDVSPTPNPNSLKITAGGETFIDSGMESFSSAAEAQRHPLGAALFAIPGITNIFILPQFLTITKSPEADWDDLYPEVEHALERYFSTR